ncbi:MAG TPA: GNAT family N-acetyltransferase [Flavihumibacter sp.]
MGSIQLVKPVEADYDALTELWEASVRATHHFLPESDINYFRPLVRNQFLALVQLYALAELDPSTPVDSSSEPATPETNQVQTKKFHAFLGVLDGKIEMLFVHPDSRGKGFGKRLLTYALNETNSTMLDVNEQNDQAVGFYKACGFEVRGRSPLDGLGKPYPLLHMQYTGTH